MNFGRITFCLVVLMAMGCGRSDSDGVGEMVTPKAAPIDSASAADSASHVIREQTEKVIGGVKFQIPAGWEEKSLSSTMILGEYSLPGEAGPARLTLSTAGGGMSANMERWKGQFQRGANDPEPKESEFAAAGTTATMLELSGSFTDMFGGGGAKPNWHLLGVAMPIDSQHHYFVKMTGPRETVQARRDEFIKFIESAQFE